MMLRPATFALIALVVLALPARAQEQRPIDVSSLGYDRGSPGAAILIIEFADFACSACGLFARETMPALQRDWVATGRARMKYIPFILGIFPRAMDAARAAECAAEQDTFWSMHDLLYRRQREWSGLGNARARMEAYAQELRLDMTRFRTCWDSDGHQARIDLNTEIARQLQIRGTPTFFINGARVTGAIPQAQMDAILQTVAGKQ